LAFDFQVFSLFLSRPLDVFPLFFVVFTNTKIGGTFLFFCTAYF
jgi:hypothetical protein